MKFIKSVSLVCMSVLCCGAVESAHAVNMTAQIKRLLDEKQHKMEELEKCEGKKKGFMIAGLSTIGLTAVGIGGNIALAAKSNKLSNEIDDKNRKLEQKQRDLSILNSKISDARNEEDCRNRNGEWDAINHICREPERGGDVNGDKDPKPERVNKGDYSGYELNCKGDNTFHFFEGDDYQDVIERLSAGCKRAGKELKESEIIKREGEKVFVCFGYAQTPFCNTDGLVQYNYGVIGEPCKGTTLEELAADVATGTWRLATDGNTQCFQNKTKTNTVKCKCDKGNGGGAGNGNGGGKVLPTRVLGDDCMSGDLPQNAKQGKYVGGKNWDCLVAKNSEEVTKCSCAPTACDDSRGFKLKNGECVLDDLVVTNSDCFDRVKKYLSDECSDCISLWDRSGQNFCKSDIDSNGGLKKVSRGETSLSTRVNDNSTLFKIIANNGSSFDFTCPGICVLANNDDVIDCFKSGGTWNEKAGQCWCGYDQSLGDKNMAQTKGLKRCECRKGYTWINESDHSLGCELGISAAENATLNKITKLAERIRQLSNKADTKVKQVETEASNAKVAGSVSKAEAMYNNALDYVADIKDVATEGEGKMQEMSSLIQGLGGQELADRVKSYETDANKYYKNLTQAYNKAMISVGKIEKIVSDLKTIEHEAAASPQAKACDASGGDWETQVDGTGYCKCTRNRKVRGLVSVDSIQKVKISVCDFQSPHPRGFF